MFYPTRAMPPARALLLAFILPSQPAPAHDLWLDKDPGGWVLHQGHRHSAHAGADIVPYPPRAVTDAHCLDAGGAIKPLPFGKTHPVKLAGDCVVVRILFSTGYWTKTPWETKNQAKGEVAGAIKSWRSEDSLKRIERWTSVGARPLGGGLEITPTSDPFKLAVGDKLTVLVTDNGRPRADVPVAYQGDTRGATGADGKIALRIRHGGMQLVAASLETPLDDGKADMLIRAATLQFELPQ